MEKTKKEIHCTVTEMILASITQICYNSLVVC